MHIANTTISRVCLLRTIQTREIVLLAMDTFYNGTLCAKSTFCGVETKNMFIHTRSSAPNMFAKFGWKTQTFCHKKVAKVIAKLESDRL